MGICSDFLFNLAEEWFWQFAKQWRTEKEPKEKASAVQSFNKESFQQLPALWLMEHSLTRLTYRTGSFEDWYVAVDGHTILCSKVIRCLWGRRQWCVEPGPEQRLETSLESFKIQAWRKGLWWPLWKETGRSFIPTGQSPRLQMDMDRFHFSKRKFFLRLVLVVTSVWKPDASGTFPSCHFPSPEHPAKTGLLTHLCRKITFSLSL